MAVGDVRGQQDDRTGRDGVAGERIVLDGHTRGEPGRRIQAQDLLDHSPCVAEAWKRLDAWHTAAEEGAALLLKLFPRIGVFKQHIPGPGEGARGRRVPRDQDGLQLVAKVGVGEGLASGRGG